MITLLDLFIAILSLAISCNGENCLSGRYHKLSSGPEPGMEECRRFSHCKLMWSFQKLMKSWKVISLTISLTTKRDITSKFKWQFIDKIICWCTHTANKPTGSNLRLLNIYFHLSPSGHRKDPHFKPNSLCKEKNFLQNVWQFLWECTFRHLPLPFYFSIQKWLLASELSLPLFTSSLTTLLSCPLYYPIAEGATTSAPLIHWSKQFLQMKL